MWHLKGGKAVVSAKGASGSISSEACSELTLSLYRVSSIRSKDHCCCCWRQTKRECSRRRRRGPKTESILTETICISTEHTGNNSSTRRNWDTLREMPQLLLLLLLNQLTRRRLCVCVCVQGILGTRCQVVCVPVRECHSFLRLCLVAQRQSWRDMKGQECQSLQLEEGFGQPGSLEAIHRRRKDH